jgi:hypothetical protein
MADIDKCKCTMSIRVLGDGCRYCQPQEYIDTLSRIIDGLEEEIEVFELEQEVDGVEVVNNG